MEVQSYLVFNGRCEEAVNFYVKALGATVDYMGRFKDAPAGDMPIEPGTEDKIMHASLRIGSTVLMASDGRCQGDADFKGFSLSVGVADRAEAERVFAALGDGGSVQMPLAKTFWTECFGMLTDRFGVSWMVSAAH